MILNIAWKNIWRSKLRSSVVIFAIAIGLLAGVFSSALMIGMLMQRVDTAISNEVSSLQLHNADFMENNEITKTIRNSNVLLSEISKDPDVRAVSKRITVESMVNSGHGPLGVMIKGVVPENEKRVSKIYKYIADSSGSFFNSKGRNPIVIGSKLAEKLKVHLRSKIQIDIVTKQGLPTSAIFRVAGIFKTDNSMFDEMTAFVKFDDLQELIEFDEDESHEIAILTKNIMLTDSLQQRIMNKYTNYIINDGAILRTENLSLKPYILSFLKSIKSSKSYNYKSFVGLLDKNIKEDDEDSKQEILKSCETGLNAMSWKKLTPDLELTTQYMDLMLFIYVGIILLALGFGIVNTMLMVVLERTKELGMLMAIGMNRSRVYSMVMLETVLLSLVGGIVGLLLSYIAVTYFGNKGINLGDFGEGLNSIGYSSLVFPALDFASYVKVVIMVIFTGIFAALYPAWKAISLNPSEAIRTE